MAKTNGIADELDNFSWDSNATDVDFFGETTPLKDTTVVEEDEEQKKKTADEETEKKKKEKEIEEEEEIFKDLGDDEGEPSGKTKKDVIKGDEDDEGTQDSAKPGSVVNFLMDKGILDLDEDEMKEFEELEDDDKAEVVKDYFEKAVEDRFAEGIKNLPDVLKNLIKYSVNGGNINTILQTLSKGSTGVDEDLDMDNEMHQETLVRKRLQDEEYDDEYIDSQIEYLKDSKRLKVTAEKYYDKWKKNQDAEAEKEAKRIEGVRKAARDREIAFKKDISKYTSELEDIKGFKLSKKDVTEMPDYIASQNVKLQDGRTITPFYRDLTEAMKDKEKLVLMAKLLRNNFDFSALTKDIDTKRTRELKDNLQRQSETKSVKSNNGSSQKPQRLIDLLD